MRTARVLLRLLALFGRRRRDRDLAAEIDNHPEMHVADAVNRAVSE